MQRLFNKAGYKIIYPKKISSLCCGMPFSSKGLFDQANYKSHELFDELNAVSDNGQYPNCF